MLLVPYVDVLVKASDNTSEDWERYERLRDCMASSIPLFEPCKTSASVSHFLQSRLPQMVSNHSTRAYFYMEEDDVKAIISGNMVERSSIIKGFFSIGITTMNLEHIGGKNKQNKLRGGYKADGGYLPVFVIGELARGRSCDKSVLPGKKILQDCISAITYVHDRIGGRLVIAESRRELLDKFYARNGFKFLLNISSNVNDEGYPLCLSYYQFDKMRC